MSIVMGRVVIVEGAAFEPSATEAQLLTICQEVSSAASGRGYRMGAINAVAQVVDADSREASFELSATVADMLVRWSGASKASPLPAFVRDVINLWK